MLISLLLLAACMPEPGPWAGSFWPLDDPDDWQGDVELALYQGDDGRTWGTQTVDAWCEAGCAFHSESELVVRQGSPLTPQTVAFDYVSCVSTDDEGEADDCAVQDGVLWHLDGDLLYNECTTRRVELWRQ